MLESILKAMDAVGERLTGLENDAIGELQRVSFTLTVTKKNMSNCAESCSASPGIENLLTFRDLEED